MGNKLKEEMVEKLNLRLKEENSCLRYIKFLEDGCITSYRITVIDKYIKTGERNYTIPSVTNEFEEFVREFFKSNFNVENTGYSNSIITIDTWE